jgi:hypothetical protein
MIQAQDSITNKIAETVKDVLESSVECTCAQGTNPCTCDASTAYDDTEIDEASLSDSDEDALIIHNENEFISFHDMATEIMQSSQEDPLTTDKQDDGSEELIAASAQAVSNSKNK